MTSRDSRESLHGAASTPDVALSVRVLREFHVQATRARLITHQQAVRVIIDPVLLSPLYLCHYRLHVGLSRHSQLGP